MNFGKEIIFNSSQPLYSCFTKVPGVGIRSSQLFLSKLGWDLNEPYKVLTATKLKPIIVFLEVLYQTYKQREQQKSLKFANFIETKCYRGWRLLFHLPLYGQNTHNNRNTRKRFNIL